jgi:hypothetical protein
MSTQFLSSLSVALLGSALFTPGSHAITLPAQTTLPVVFTHTVNAAKAKVGDPVTAKTMQVVLLPDGTKLPKGTLVTGHVVEATGFKFNDTPYATQQPSTLAIAIDAVAVQGAASPVVTDVRAMADAISVEQALTPHHTDETDFLGTVVLVGGAHYSPIDKRVTAGEDDDIVAYNKNHGVFAHLLPGSSQTGFLCAGTQTEQSVAIFSPDACGLYGFKSVSLTENNPNGAFRLTSTHHTVTLYAGSAALLQVK